MNRGFWLIILPVLVFGLQAPKTLAHIEAQDGKISAFLHIEPNDRPIPGQKNTVHFYFNDLDFRFALNDCDCTAKVTENGKILYMGGINKQEKRVGQIDVFLPDNNTSYDVVVSGTPKTAGFFQPFKLNFDIDVGNPPPRPVKKSQGTLIIAITVSSIVVVGAAGFYFWAIKRHNSKDKGDDHE